MTSPFASSQSGRRTSLAAAAAAALALALGACGTNPDDDPGMADPFALTWISPSATAMIETNDPVPIVVSTTNFDARVVHFSVDGREIGVCDATDRTSDCRMGSMWRFTTMIPTVGRHTLAAWFDRPSAPPVRVEREVTVLAATADDDAGATPDDAGSMLVDSGSFVFDDASADAARADAAADARPADAAVRDAAPPPPPPPPARGFLDPDRPYHNIFGGISWAVRSQEVLLRSGPYVGSVTAVSSCMTRFGASIRRWADRYRVSRAAVVATAITESGCTNPRGSSDGLSSGPMQVTGTTCASLTGLSSSTCRTRMYTNPDFSFDVGTRYIASTYQRRQHGNDPPKISAAYNAGSLRSTTANRWHMVTTGNHIDRFVQAYNAYRAWERRMGIAVEYGPAEVFFEGEHVAAAADLPATARDGQQYFVGDWANRDGEFYVYFNGGWHRLAE